MAYEFIAPKKIIYGNGSLLSSIEYISQLGNKALIVTGKNVSTKKGFKDFISELSEAKTEYAIFDEITGEPTDKMILAGVVKYSVCSCDFIICFGGGSPIDAGKAIGVLINGGKIADYLGVEITIPTPAIVAIPTTAGTGSEATKYTVITDSKKGIKMLLYGNVLIPTLAVVDPILSTTAPKAVTAFTALDALTHAIEAYTGRKAQPMCDAFCISAVEKIFKYLPLAYENPNDIKAREELSSAALFAGIAINNSSVTIVHGMSRPIGALFHVPHGLSNAMLLEKALGFVLDGNIKKFANLGRVTKVADEFSSDEAAANRFIISLAQLCKACDIPTLHQYGINKEEFYEAIDKMSLDAINSGSPNNAVKQPSTEDIKTIYKSLWD